VRPDGGGEDHGRALVAEAPIAVEIGGVGYAVMMATPADLPDFAIGFCLSERLADGAKDIEAVDLHRPPPAREGASSPGVLLRVTLVPRVADRVFDRVRHRLSDSSCGLCGIENLEQAVRPLPRVPAGPPVAPGAVFASLAALRDHQPLGRATGAAHAAALCAADGAVRLVREDVGRHNAFDKLIGAMALGALGWDGGFALVTSRLSYEIVEKAALAGCPAIAAISAPTSLAADRAAEAGIRLFALARPDALLMA
jgi:FdhD protein